MRTIVFTMVFNEAENVERWAKYYKEQLGQDSILFIDNASDDASVDFIRKNRNISYPKMTFSNTLRASFISSLAEALLNLYDTVIYTDVDEFIVANPAKYTNLSEFLEKNNHESYTCLGFDLVHIVNEEKDCSLTEPLLKFRKHLKPMRSMCKTLITRRPIKWGGGFHTSDAKPRFHEDLWLFHTKSADFQQRLRRQIITRQVIRDDNSGEHQRWDDEKLARIFASFARERREKFVEAEISKLLEKVSPPSIERKYYEQIDLIKYGLANVTEFEPVIYRLDDSFPSLF